MSYSVQIPWMYTREHEEVILQAEVLKTILRNICKRHRFYQPQWQMHNTKQQLEIRQLVKDMTDLEVFATNRKEQITTAIHCLIIWLNNKECHYDDYVQILQLGPVILTQLESKIGNRFYHDVRTYRCKQLLKVNKMQGGKTSVRCYLINGRADKLDYNYNDCIMGGQNEDFNFPRIKTGKLRTPKNNNRLIIYPNVLI